MALKLLCVVRDIVAESVGPVMLFAALPAAVRAFGDLALDPQSTVNRHTADFELLHIATVDDASGEVRPCVPVVCLLSGATWMAAQAPGPRLEKEA